MPSYQPNDILLDKYRIERLLGQGAFGEVYLAVHNHLNVRRALKVLRRDAEGIGSSLYAEGRARFQLESQLGAQVNHPHLIQVFDFDDAEGEMLLAMEFAPGGSLQKRINSARECGQPIPLAEITRTAREVAAGLAVLHQREVVHRDLKPSNILFGADGSAKIADLGLAQIPSGASMRSRLSVVEHHPGTPAYMSPEQETSFAYLPPASDVYTLGLILFELLCGRSYRGLRPGTPARSLRPDTPAWLDELLAVMLAKDPEQRPWDGQELAERLRAGDSQPAKTPPSQETPAELPAPVAASPPQPPKPAAPKVEENRLVVPLADGVVMEFCRVPAGAFQMGSADSDKAAYSKEKPQHRVILDEYWIGKYPVTNRQYQVFVQQTGQKPPEHWSKGVIPQGKENHPVVKVSWEEARAFCAWASKVSGQSIRLPSEAEWEKATRGTDGHIYPWGDQAPNGQLANFNNHEKGTTAVGQYPAGASPYGALDMAGNVWEWVADWYGPYPSEAVSNPTGPGSGETRVLRGGSWNCGSNGIRTANRVRGNPDNRSGDFGFRCAR
ncbi:bifunctional serine/threonine-protein kinase/formylglycine-generating enzyme family protein [Levilinea saccharolytica]|uniref:bifunctional serine/threonine-protein kinase/formylglycine-generating enzyme family protein n=1 Tax=Levilinea saccharolytica TaxID=229921 RepID=UPI000783028C|nr:bifunctional serine/threonine-protein kinase/formylglycine-generating enzyme family protein [Levilinea saccharolytica]GAP18524.1 uncharacterized conserved protein [Levilinea saccharolytica]